MATNNINNLLIRASNTSGVTPSSLASGLADSESTAGASTEIAINRADGKLFYLNHEGTVTEFSTAASVSGNTFATDLVIGRDAHNYIDFSTDNVIRFRANDAQAMDMTVDGNGHTTFKPLVDSKKFRFLQYDGNEVMTINDNENVTVTNDLTVGDDLLLNSDSAVLSMGAGADVTITHDGSTGATLASAGDFIIDCEADITLDANGGDVKLLDGGAMYGVFTNNSGQLTIKSGATSSLVLNGSDVTVADDLVVTDDLTVSGDLAVTGSYGLASGDIPNNAADTSGNAATATALATARTINGTSFDGTGNITLGNDSVTNAMMADDAIDTAQLADSAVNTARLAADAVTGAKIADDAINSEHYTDGSIDTAHIGDDQVTYAKIQNVSATNRILGRDSSGAGVIEEITPANLRTMINVADGATANAGTVTSVGTGTGLTGTVTSSGNLSLSHLGIESLSDPGADRLLIWDDSAGAIVFATPNSNLAISGTNVNATDTNTTYSVGDGGLTTNDFTNADHTKLNGIEASADVTDASNVASAMSGITLSGNVNFGDNDITNVDSLDADKFSIAGGTEMTAINDEDDMSSNSATALATQQSIKAYVDANAGGGGTAADDVSTGDAAVTIGTSSGSVTLDAATDVILDAATGITHIRDAGDSDDELKITVAGGTGATTIETISAGADGHLTMKADGDLQISATSASEKSVISTSAGVLNENTQFIYVVTAGMSKVGTSSHERHLSFNTTSGNSTNSNGDLFNHYHLMPFPAKLVSVRGAFSSSVSGSASTFFRIRKAADNATSLSDVYKWNNTNVAGIHAPDAMTEQGVGGAGDSFEFLDAIRGAATVETGTSGVQTFNEGDKIFGGFSVPSSVGTDIRGCFTFVFVATTGYTAP